MGNTVVNKTTGEKINISNANKASIKKGVKNITNQTGKKYTIVECNKKSSFKSIGESMGKMGTSIKESTGDFLAKKESANLIITKKDIENVTKLFALGSFDRDIIYRIFKENINNLSKEHSLTVVIKSIKTKKTTFSISISNKFQEICNEYKDSNYILKEKNIVNKPNNVQRIENNKSENNITNKYESYQVNLIKLFSAVYEYSISNKYKNNKNKFVSTPWKGFLADPNRVLKTEIKKKNKLTQNTPIKVKQVNNKNKPTN
jgi:hypothetical protein